MKILYLLLLVFLCSCYPFCETSEVSGSISSKKYKPSYYEEINRPHKTCSTDSDGDEVCFTYYTRDQIHHPERFLFDIKYNDKDYQREVSKETFIKMEVGDWVSFSVCKSDLPK